MGPWTHAALVKDKESRALGLVAVRGPVGVALAARLLVAGRARRHAAADAAALEARPGADVLARVRAAPHVARAPAVFGGVDDLVRRRSPWWVGARSSLAEREQAKLGVAGGDQEERRYQGDDHRKLAGSHGVCGASGSLEWTKGGAGLEVSRVESCGLAGWGLFLCGGGLAKAEAGQG